MPRKILLADDSVTAQNMGRRILSEAGYDVVTVNNGSAALKKLVEHKPDLVILDIYMPGYGGIEVCQKIKEDPQTSHLPVLLTVGKLEPFKADEARRVQADAHLVKPFEATELLAALTKLEDKVVPQPEGRSIPVTKAKTAEKAAPSGKDKEKKEAKDSENGWKQRLRISKSGSKRQLAEEKREERKNPSTAFREIVRREVPDTATATLAESLPADITAEEIAAIASAAAALEGSLTGSESQHSEVVAEPSSITAMESNSLEAQELPPQAVEAPSPNQAATTAQAEAQPEPDCREQTEFATQVEAPVEEYAPSKEYCQQEAHAEEPEAPTALNSEVEISEAPAVQPDIEPTDAEVTAALEALAPVQGNAFPGAGQNAVAEAEIVEDGIARFSRGWGEVSIAERWIAQEVALSGEEGSLILEEEMEKGRAALAELELERTQPLEAQAETVVADESASGGFERTDPGHDSNQAEVGENLPAEVGLISALDSSAPTSEAPEPEPVAEAPVEPAKSFETEERTATEAIGQIEVEQIPEPEPQGAEALAQHEATTVAKVEQMPQTGEVSAEVAEVNTAREEAAYAAAASMSNDFRNITREDETSAAVMPESESARAQSEAPETAAEPSEQEATLAAAWANWRQIRESIASPQFTQQVADVAAAGYKEIHPPQSEAPQPASSNHDKSGLAADSAAIASIVDSVLAELKPKLVEEIAKKLGKETK